MYYVYRDYLSHIVLVDLMVLITNLSIPSAQVTYEAEPKKCYDGYLRSVMVPVNILLQYQGMHKIPFTSTVNKSF